MSKCLKCGVTLPPTGDCPSCALAQREATPAAPPPPLLDRDLQLDRRRGPERSANEPAWSSAPVGAPAAPARAPASALPLAGPLPAARPPAIPAAPVAAGLPSLPPVPRAAPPSPAVHAAAAPAAAAPVFAAAPVAATPAPVAAAPAPVAAPGEVHARPASLWRRLMSFAVDAGVIVALAALYLTLASAITGLQGPKAELGGLDGLVLRARAYESILLPGLVLTVLLALVYCAVAAFLWNGRTLGRRLLGLRLVDRHGLAPAPTRAVVRALLAGVSFAIFLGGFWLALFDRRGQTLHDKLTSTFVVQPS